jgi:MraZ protein
MFRGNHPTRVDDKGRLKLPAAYKSRVDEAYGNGFYITSLDGKRAWLYPLREWEKKEQQLQTMPSTHPARQKFLDFTTFYGSMAKMDDQGRLLLPQILRESAKLTGDVVVLGKMEMLEVVNFDDFKGSLEQAPLTEADLAALAQYGL